MKRYCLLIVFLLFSVIASGQRSEYPVFGAQIFIEPGQSDEQIENYFSVMEDCGMKVGRIRLFGTHVQKAEGWDFSLYDKAFDAAWRHGVRLFVTLFPPTDELTDLGGFKFPSSKKHLDEIDAYTRACVAHYKDHPAMYVWVLQNEPGLEDATKLKSNDLVDEIYAQWLAAQATIERCGNEYLKGDLRDEAFLRYFTSWYLKHVSDIVEELDPTHGRHVNPHQIMKNLPQYDFAEYSQFLTSLGASMHLSWHFGLFNQDEYPLGVSLMADIIRSSARENPFWVTELQGGSVIWSGRAPYCPSAEHVRQYLWTCVGAGAEGVIFWTLNQRRSVMEAGEWGMLDYMGRPTERLLAAKDVAAQIEEHSDFFSAAHPYESPINILYNNESLIIQKRESDTWGGKEPGRFESGVMLSVIAAYQAIAAHGVTPQLREMSNFDWTDYSQIVILPDMICLPEVFVDPIRDFVKNGGKLIVTGRSCFFDDHMRCRFMGGFELADCFGAKLTEFRAEDNNFRGLLEPSSGTSFVDKYSGATGVRNRYGKGEVVWVPTTIDLNSYHGDILPLARFYGRECRAAIESAPFHFKKPVKDVLARTMVTEDRVAIILIDKSGCRLNFRPISR